MIRNSLMASAVTLILLSGVAAAQDAPAAGPFTAVETAVCKAIEDRMPVDTGSVFAPDVDRVWFWTKLTGAADITTVTHVWMYQGNEMASVELPVKGASWRTYSSKAILPMWVGDWQVQVRDAQGNILKSVSFKIAQPVEKKAEPQPEAETESDSM